MTFIVAAAAMSTSVTKKIQKKKKKRKALIHHQSREKVQSPGKLSSSPDIPLAYISDNAEGNLLISFCPYILGNVMGTQNGRMLIILRHSITT